MAYYVEAEDLIVWCEETLQAQSTPAGMAYVNAFLEKVLRSNAADVVSKGEVERLEHLRAELSKEVDQLKKALEAQEAEYSQALHDKAREYNMVVDKICLEHRAEYARLHEAHAEELAKAKREVARKVIAEVNLLISKYRLEPNYSMGQMEIDLSELEKKYTKGA